MLAVYLGERMVIGGNCGEDYYGKAAENTS